MLKEFDRVKIQAPETDREPATPGTLDATRVVIAARPGTGKTLMTVLLACLERVPFLQAMPATLEPHGPGGPDAAITVDSPAGEQIILVEAKASGQPRLARDAINQLLRERDAFPNAYGVFGAPYISPQAAQICEQEGVGYVDLAGNCLLSFGQVYIRQEGKSNPFARKRDLRSLYSPKAERVLRVLLNDRRKTWKLEALAREAGVSLGQAHNVKKLLADREWIRTGPDGLWLREPEQLLREWADNYRDDRSRVHGFYSMKSPSEIEAELREFSAIEGVRFALTGFSGAARLAPFVRYQRAAAYVQGSIDSIARGMGAKEVTSGANLSLIEPYDEGVFYGARDIDGERVAAPIQIYLDLCAIRGRGEEAAQALLEQVIRPQWQAVDPNTTIHS